jgi:hypothetical protein
LDLLAGFAGDTDVRVMSSLLVTGLTKGDRIIQIFSAINCRFSGRILVRSMRVVFVIAAAIVTVATAGEPPFYGNPRASMRREFWSGVQQSSVNTKWFKTAVRVSLRGTSQKASFRCCCRISQDIQERPKVSHIPGSCMAGRTVVSWLFCSHTWSLEIGT